MTLTQLRYLLAIVDTRLNISLAALQLNTTQPAISRQLKLLEEELGFQIFTRRGKSLTQLTESGSAIVEHVRGILGGVRNIETVAANHRHDTRGTLRIATTQSLGRFVLPAALGRLRSRFGAVRLRLRQGGELECLAMLERDEIDLGLVSTQGERPNCEVAIPLFTWQRIVVTPSDHPLAKHTSPLTLEQLTSYPLIAAETVTDVHYKLGQVFHAAGLIPDIACTARDADTLKTFVRQSLGVGLMSQMSLTEQDNDLLPLEAGHLFPTCTTWAVLRRDRIQRDYVFELLRELSPQLTEDDINPMLEGHRSLPSVAPWKQAANVDPAES